MLIVRRVSVAYVRRSCSTDWSRWLQLDWTLQHTLDSCGLLVMKLCWENSLDGELETETGLNLGNFWLEQLPGTRKFTWFLEVYASSCLLSWSAFRLQIGNSRCHLGTGSSGSPHSSRAKNENQTSTWCSLLVVDVIILNIFEICEMERSTTGFQGVSEPKSKVVGLGQIWKKYLEI